MNEMIFTACIVAIPPTLAALLLFRSNRENNALTREIHRQTQPSNGATVAETIEETQRELQDLRGDLTYHITVQHGRGPIQDPEEG